MISNHLDLLISSCSSRLLHLQENVLGLVLLHLLFFDSSMLLHLSENYPGFGVWSDALDFSDIGTAFVKLLYK